MKKLLLLFALLTVSIFPQYITPNTGVVWNMDDLVSNSGGVVTGSFPDYEISNLVNVSSNDQINISDGISISFVSGSAGFEVDGILTAIGTETDSIKFSSPSSDSTGSWVGLKFNENVNSTSSIIEYARIEFAESAFRCIDASPTLTNSYIFKCSRGVQLSGSNATISLNRIERCYEYGILMTLSSSPLIEGNYLLKNNTQNTSAKNQISIGLQGNNSPVIKNNIIEGGASEKAGGISLWVNGASNFSNMIAEGNTIFNNSYGITLYSTGDGQVNAEIKNNHIYNNNVNPNVMISGSGINVNGSPFNQPVIKRNTITGNWWGITIQNGATVQPGPQPNIGNIENADTSDDGENIIYGNLQGNQAYDLYNNCTNDIYAQNNDWGVYDSSAIEENIFHQVDDPAHGLVKFIPFAQIIPVELVSFNANVFDNNVKLEWKTATEVNNQGFEIQRTPLSPPFNKGGKQKVIGYVDGNGTTSDEHNYSFTDKNLTSGKYLYRLRQIDFDGSFEFSQEIEVEIKSPEEFLLEQNYPNPFNPVTTIKFSLPSPLKGEAPGVRSNFVTLKVYDILGNEIANLVNEPKQPGVYEVNFDASNLPAGRKNLSSGIYYYRLTTGKFISTKKMILIK